MSYNTRPFGYVEPNPSTGATGTAVFRGDIDMGMHSLKNIGCIENDVGPITICDDLTIQGDTIAQGDIFSSQSIIMPTGEPVDTLKLLSVTQVVGVPTGAAPEGSLAYDTVGDDLYLRANGAWTQVHTDADASSLAQVLAIGNTTGVNDIEIDSGQSVNFASQVWLDQTASNGVIRIGYNTTAGNTGAIVIGRNTSVTSLDGIALGAGATSTGAGYNIAIGRNSSSTSVLGNAQSIAIGDTALASKRETLAVGYIANATGDDAIALGSRATASASRSIAIGRQVTASGLESIGIGYLAVSSGSSSIALGDTSLASATGASALSPLSSATHEYSTVVGYAAESFGPKATIVTGAKDLATTGGDVFIIGGTGAGSVLSTAGAVHVLGNEIEIVSAAETIFGGPVRFPGTDPINTTNLLQITRTTGVPTTSGVPGALCMNSVTGDLYYHDGTSWQLINTGAGGSSDLANILAAGNETTGNNIVVNSGDVLQFKLGDVLIAATDNTANILMGSITAPSLSSATSNILVGNFTTGSAITSGDDNVLCGTRAGDTITTGTGNVAIGLDSMSILTTGSNNTAIGPGAGSAGISTISSVAIGLNASANSSSVSIGPSALCTGQSAISIGSQSQATASNAVAIGFSTSCSGARSLAIGYDLFNSTNDKTLIGCAGQIELDSADLLVSATRQRFGKQITGITTDADVVLTAAQVLDSIILRGWSTNILRICTLPTWAQLNAELVGGFLANETFEFELWNDNVAGLSKTMRIASSTSNIRRCGLAGMSTVDINGEDSIRFIAHSTGSAVNWYVQNTQ